MYGKCVFLNFLLLKKMLEAWYRCPQLGCLHEHSRFQCGALLLVCDGAKSMEIRVPDLIWSLALRFGVIFM